MLTFHSLSAEIIIFAVILNFFFEVTWRIEHLQYFFSSRMQMDQVWVYNCHYLLHRNVFSVAQCLRAQLQVGSAALVSCTQFLSQLCFALVDSVQTVGFVLLWWIQFRHLSSVRQVRFKHKVWQVAVVWLWHKRIGCCMHESA